MTSIPTESEASSRRGLSLPARLFSLTPFYALAVRREARRIITACGRSAAEHARQEADETLSREWSRFMRHVAARIERQQGAAAS